MPKQRRLELCVSLSCDQNTTYATWNISKIRVPKDGFMFFVIFETTKNFLWFHVYFPKNWVHSEVKNWLPQVVQILSLRAQYTQPLYSLEGRHKKKDLLPMKVFPFTLWQVKTWAAIAPLPNAQFFWVNRWHVRTQRLRISCWFSLDWVLHFSFYEEIVHVIDVNQWMVSYDYANVEDIISQVHSVFAVL